MENNQRLTQFNATLQTWIDAVDDYTLEMLHTPPRPGSWSLGQLYTHLLDDTGWFVEQMEITLTSNENADEEMNADAKRMFANNSFPDIQIQGPATNKFVPQPSSKEELRQRLMTLKANVNRLFAGNDGTRARGKTKHPGLMYFNAGEWLQIAEMHLRHHFRQKARIDEALGSMRR